MKCESCHQAEAKAAVTVDVEGVKKEIYVCTTCAAKLRGKNKSKKSDPASPKKATPEITVLNGETEPPPPFVEELVKATLGFMKGVAEAEENDKRVCPVCKAKWDQIKSSGRIGCPACWKTFARKIRETFLGGEWGPSHIGAAPTIDRIPDPAAARAVLERELKDAIAREDYRRAAALKRKLDGLSGGKDTIP